MLGGIVLIIAGCTIVIWSDDASIFQDTGVGDDQVDKIDLPKRIKNVTTK